MKLAHQIEGQLREAYAKKCAAGEINQTQLAEKLGVNRSAVNRRLSGRTNMTIKTVAEMVWALDHDIDVKIFDQCQLMQNAIPLIDTGKPVSTISSVRQGVLTYPSQISAPFATSTAPVTPLVSSS